LLLSLSMTFLAIFPTPEQKEVHTTKPTCLCLEPFA